MTESLPESELPPATRPESFRFASPGEGRLLPPSTLRPRPAADNYAWRYYDSGFSAHYIRATLSQLPSPPLPPFRHGLIGFPAPLL
ncbi:unnamed protein product [Schistocephalus solidus]|uniref:Uncharacterized protein n=1 Tax=Schistocephalus solidus TaxID=70667 RepID=A0A183TQ55_SCHSO|nr:unnamed protein product [Schistocephalus solidus]